MPARLLQGNKHLVRAGATSAVAAILLLLAGQSELPAQGTRAKKGAPEIETVSGKVTSIEKKGKAVTLTVEKEGGDTLELLITPKMKTFSVSGRGDAGFFASKMVVSSDSIIMANNELFGHKFTVHLAGGPPMAVKRDPNSSEIYQVCGQVVSADAESVTLNFGSNGTRKIRFEQGATLDVLVASTDADMVTEGASVQVEGTTRGTRFLPSRVAVTLDKPLVADEFFASKKEGAGKKQAAQARTSKKGSKAKSDEDKSDLPASGGDPFGVLGKKDDATSGKGPKKAEPNTGENPDSKAPDSKAPEGEKPAPQS